MTNPGRLDQTPEVAVARDLPDGAVGSTASLREIFVVHGAYVWNTLRRFGIRDPDLEDLTHDVFLQVERHLGEFDPSRPIRPWLFGFAYRIASQYRRRAHRRHERHREPDELIDQRPRPDEQIAADEQRRLVLAALERLDLERRAVFVLYEIDETPMAEIAKALRIPVNTGYSRLRVARAEFTAALKILKRREDR